MMLEGLRLMGVGMLTVFAFLGLLVGLMKACAAFFEANADRFPDPAPERTRAPRTDEGEVALAIALAEAAREGLQVSRK